MNSPAQLYRQLKTNACFTFHQLGNKSTREIPEALGTFPNSVAAWERRVRSGQAGGNMTNGMNAFGPRGYKMYAEWNDRVSGGAIPPAHPRTQGAERDVVITMWDWDVLRFYNS